MVDPMRVLEAESAWLRRCLVLSKSATPGNQQLKTAEALQRAARYHTCRNDTCVFRNLNPHTSFRSEDGRQWRATGDVFICQQFGAIHLCGERYCDEKVRVPKGEGMACRLTGMHLADEFSKAQDRTDPDIRQVGSYEIQSYSFKRDTFEAGLSEKRHERGMVAQLEFDDEDSESRNSSITLDITHSLSSSTSSAAMVIPYYEDATLASSSTDRSGVKRKADNSPTFQPVRQPTLHSSTLLSSIASSIYYERLFAVARGNDSDIKRVLALYPESTEQFLCARLHERMIRRKKASEVWDVHAMTQPYIDKMTARVNAATTEWEYFITKYMFECQKRKEVYSIFHVIELFKTLVLPHCKGVYYGVDVDALNRRNSKYFIEYILRVWECFEKLPPVKGRHPIKFENCITAILKYLQEGLIIEVYLVGANPKPRRWSKLTELEQQYAVGHRLVIIDPHPNLILATTEEVRKIHPSDSSHSSSSSGTTSSGTRPSTTAITSFVFNRKNFGSRQKPNIHRRHRQHTKVIPALKSLLKLVSNAIEVSATIDELQQYCSFSYRPLEGFSLSN